MWLEPYPEPLVTLLLIGVLLAELASYTARYNFARHRADQAKNSVRRRRTEKDWSDIELAERVDVTRPMLISIERE